MRVSRADRLSGVVSRSTPVAPPDHPRSVLAAFEDRTDDAAAPLTVWAPPDDSTVVAGGAAATVVADGADRFDRVREATRTLLASGDVHAGTPAARPRLFGGFAFHDSGDAAHPWDEFPGARFVLPRVQLTYTDGDGPDAWLTVTAAGEDATRTAVERRLDRERAWLSDHAAPRTEGRPGVRSRSRTTTRSEWTESVEDAVGRVRAGQLRKVVLAQGLAVRLRSPLDVPGVLARLGRTYPDCYRFLVEPGDDRPLPAFFGATPERLVSLRGRAVHTGALAGTTGRGETTAEDDRLAEDLLADAKNAREHELVVEAVRDQLAPFARTVETGERRVRRLATVQHLYTPIDATLDRDAHALDLVESLHPTPAVGGLPPDEALATIRATEPFDRGWYAAPVGWVDAAGDGEFAVGIRSAVTTADRETVTAFAGVGLVEDSDPDREWEEVELKYRPILDELES